MDVTKFIINNLNKPPFDKKFNFINFDSLQQEELIQLLSDVISEISNEEKIDIHLEDPEQTMVRLFNSLRILKYAPPADGASNFRTGLINGEKSVIYPILKWLLSNISEVKSRAYLGKFLVKIVIPNDVMGNTDIAMLYQQYEMLIDEFTKCHKEYSAMKDNKIITSELISDCGAIEREKEIVSTRIEQLKRKIETIPSSENILNASHKLRLAKAKQKELSHQLQDELSMIQRGHQQFSRITQQLQELKNNSTSLSPNMLLNNLGEETHLMSYIANEKLPYQVMRQKKELQALQNIASSDEITEDTNLILSAKIQSLSEQIDELKQSKSSLNQEKKSTLYGQQAGIIANVKDSLVEEYFQLKNVARQLSYNLDQKKKKLQEMMDHIGIATGDEFQEYVRKLRAQSVVYKRQRTDLAAFKTEVSILGRTLKKLQDKESELSVNTDEEITDSLTCNEDTVELKTDNEWMQLITNVCTEIARLKSKLTPYISDIKPLKEEAKEIKLEYERVKNVYDRTAAALDSNLAKLKNDVDILREEHEKMVEETKELKTKACIAKVNLERANYEAQMYLDKNNATQTLRERYNIKILESEKNNKLLKEEQKIICENEEKFLKQRQLWSNINSLLEFKRKLLQVEQSKSGVLHLEKGSETLVLYS